MAAAAFARPATTRDTRRVNAAALFGGVLPDLSLYGLVAGALLLGRPLRQVFEEDYFSPTWQTVFAIDNSAPLYAALLALGLWRAWPWLVALSGAALLHIATDLPLHHDDGRPHFWPFSDWVFESPISYWDPAAHGGVVSILELGLAAALTFVLWRRFTGLGARLTLGLSIASIALVGVFWAVAFAVA